MAGEKIVSFQCLQCGSPIPVHALGQSLSFACRSCGAVVEENSEGQRILQRASQEMRWQPLLELGSKAKFRGETWQVLGFMVRSDGSGDYLWNEYLLFNPYQGFRWLTEAEGHWNYILMTRHKPTQKWGSGVHWSGRSYRLYLKGEARVQFVLGEFYWRVRVGDTVKVRDYIAPPEILSCEEDGSEQMWSAGTYVDPADIEKSFQLTGPMPRRSGIAPNQPSHHAPRMKPALWNAAIFMGLLLVLQIVMSRRHASTLLQQNFTRHAGNAVEVLRSDPFQIDQDNEHITIKLAAQLPDSWIYLRTTLVGEDGQLPNPVEFGRDLVGTDEDGDPLYGTRSEDVFINHLSKGRYHLEMVSEAEAKQNINVALQVIAGETLVSPFLMCLMLLAVYPLAVMIRNWRFETDRWANSDP